MSDDSLRDALLGDGKQEQVVGAFASLVESTVAAKRGLSGAAIKTAFALVRKLKPNFTAGAMRALLPEFCDALDPLYQQWRGGAGGSLAQHVQSNSDTAVQAMLTVTDRVAGQSDKAAIKSTYNKLRPRAEDEVRAVMPQIAALVEKYAG